MRERLSIQRRPEAIIGRFVVPMLGRSARLSPGNVGSRSLVPLGSTRAPTYIESAPGGLNPNQSHIDKAETNLKS
jgi:hypothetical protein